MRNHLLEKLIEKRFNRKAIERVILDESKRKRPAHRRRAARKQDGFRELQGVYRGNYYRVKVPDMQRPQTTRISRLPATAPAPNLSALVADATVKSPAAANGHKRHSNNLADQAAGSLAKIQQQQQQSTNNAWKQFRDWFTANAGTLLLNLGSLCTLAAFTRTDVL